MEKYKVINDNNNCTYNMYKNDNDFTYKSQEYKYDSKTNRYYKLEQSKNKSNLKMIGILVKHRISKKLYVSLLKECKLACKLKEDKEPKNKKEKLDVIKNIQEKERIQKVKLAMAVKMLEKYKNIYKQMSNS